MFSAYRFSVVISSLFVLAACGRGFSIDPSASANLLESNLCTTSVKTNVFDELNRLADEQAGYPSEQGLREALSQRLAQHWGNSLSRSQEDSLVEASGDIASIYNEVLNEAMAAAPKNDQDLHHAMLIALAELESGDESTPSRARVQSEMTAKFAHARAVVEQIDSACTESATKPVERPTPDTTTLLGQWQKTQAKPVYGAWKTMSIAYQSCDVVEKDPLTSKTPSVQGITQYKNSSGTYYRRFTSVAEFVRTNPYYKNYRAPASSCVQVEKNPLVYDYGGKPYYANSLAALNLFKQHGGTPNVLGIDCSGFVSSALMTAGLRFRANTPLRTQYVERYAARSYQNPSASGMSCLKPISVSKAKTIVAGDILASAGHVIMIDEVGSDPFGIDKFTSASQCTASNISSTKFNFTVIQSSPVKNSIGIDRIAASSFFQGTEVSMRNALEKYAVAACKARFGSATTPSYSEATLVRHTGTAECLETKPVAMTSQDCVSSCPARN